MTKPEITIDQKHLLLEVGKTQNCATPTKPATQTYKTATNPATIKTRRHAKPRVVKDCEEGPTTTYYYHDVKINEKVILQQG